MNLGTETSLRYLNTILNNTPMSIINEKKIEKHSNN